MSRMTMKKNDFTLVKQMGKIYQLMFHKEDVTEPVYQLDDNGERVIGDDGNPIITGEKDTDLCTALVEIFHGKITESEVRSRLAKYYDSITDWKILSGFEWKGMKVWLSMENQFNYKAAYDLAVQTNGASLPVTFKFGDNNNPVYHEFTTLEELTDFYTKVLQYINTTLKEGWDKKDSIDWSKYSTNEGTKEDPIVYVPGMVLELGKYYIEGGIIYMCHKDSESIMKGNLKDYVDTYLTLISK